MRSMGRGARGAAVPSYKGQAIMVHSAQIVS
jgi:hypothetical protein